MNSKNRIETLENVRENINYNLNEGVKNRRSDFRTFTLCTADEFVSARTVVLRGYNPTNGIITLHSNYYSEKIMQLQVNSAVCCVFYNKLEKLQIRCFGTATINHNNDRAFSCWNSMSDMSKECYFQEPYPGTSIDNFDDFSKNISDKQSECFCVIDIKVEKIDWLYLKREGHKRANIFVDDEKNDTWVSP